MGFILIFIHFCSPNPFRVGGDASLDLESVKSSGFSVFHEDLHSEFLHWTLCSTTFCFQDFLVVIHESEEVGMELGEVGMEEFRWNFSSHQDLWEGIL